MLPQSKRKEKAGLLGKLGIVGAAAMASLLVLVGTGTMAFAARGGGFGGGFHGGFTGSFHGGGFHGGALHGGGFRGGGFRGGAFHDGFRGRFYGAGFPGWWWGPGWFGLGFYLATLPAYYETYWWDNVPYYYVNNDYYAWNGDVGEYEQVQPPPQIAQQGPGPAPAAGDSLFVYPKNGQTEQQQASDENQCSTWASGQTDYVPAPAASAAANDSGGAALAKRQNFVRADGACLEARGYSVE
jgi:hypothetical protein